MSQLSASGSRAGHLRIKMSNVVMPPHRLSKMKRDLFSLYRSFLRVSKMKGGIEARTLVREEFRRTVRVTTNMKHAEAVYARGVRKLNMLQKADSIQFKS